MINPFKHTAKTVKEVLASAQQNDCVSPGEAAIGILLIVPIVAPVAFISAFFKKS